MSTDITTPQPSVVDPMLNWEVPTPPTDLVFEDGEPLETPRHRIAMNLLICYFVLLPEEAEQQRADQERQRADRAEQEKVKLLERLRGGIDPQEFLN